MTEQQIDNIIVKLKTASLPEKLEAINSAQSLYKEFFYPGMSIAEWAKRALQVETLYNLIREELRLKQVRMKKKEDLATPTKRMTPPKPKGTKRKPFKVGFDPDALIAEYKKKMGGGE